MSKVKIVLEPKEPITFTGTVQVPTPDGSKLAIEWVFKHRTREQMGKWIDAQIASAKEAAEDKPEEAAKTVAQLMHEQTAREVASVLDVAQGWNVDGLEFTAANIARLLNAYPGTANAVLDHYRVSVTQGRLGN